MAHDCRRAICSGSMVVNCSAGTILNRDLVQVLGKGLGPVVVKIWRKRSRVRELGELGDRDGKNGPWPSSPHRSGSRTKACLLASFPWMRWESSSSSPPLAAATRCVQQCVNSSWSWHGSEALGTPEMIYIKWIKRNQILIRRQNMRNFGFQGLGVQGSVGTLYSCQML